MGKEVGWRSFTLFNEIRDDLAKLFGIPVNDHGREQIHAGDTIVLLFRCPVADFTSPIETDRSSQGVVCFALVETQLCTSL